jgi:hypothetical protein
MPARSDRSNGSRPAFAAWLRHNPTGLPRRHALRVAAIGVGQGLLGGLGAGILAGSWHTTSPWLLGLGIACGSLTGATLGPLAVVLLARLLDRVFRAADSLIGYSGVLRMLLHAGELSFLGALAGGIGGGIGGLLAGMAGGALAGSGIGAILYRARGLGGSLGVMIGALSGGIGGAIGGVVTRLGR